MALQIEPVNPGRPQTDRRIVAAYEDGLTECPGCRIYFAAKTRRQQYCSDTCRQRIYDRKRRKGV